MRFLYQHWLSPDCRAVRVVCEEKRLDYEVRVEKTWERRPEFLALNPAAEVPVLVEPDGTVVAGALPICEYLEEIAFDAGLPLLGTAPAGRAEVRRLVNWFGQKFAREVTTLLLSEKIDKLFMGRGEPDSDAIRAGKKNLGPHLDYIAFLTERRRWLAGEHYSLADIAAATQICCLDYLDDVPWDKYEGARDWYARIKSRPTFRPLLADHIPGLPPPKHYADLDF